MNSNVKEQAERLVELNERAMTQAYTMSISEWEELKYLSNHFTRPLQFATAYLEERKAHEQTQEKLKDILAGKILVILEEEFKRNDERTKQLEILYTWVKTRVFYLEKVDIAELEEIIKRIEETESKGDDIDA